MSLKYLYRSDFLLASKAPASVQKMVELVWIEILFTLVAAILAKPSLIAEFLRTVFVLIPFTSTRLFSTAIFAAQQGKKL